MKSWKVDPYLLFVLVVLPFAGCANPADKTEDAKVAEAVDALKTVAVLGGGSFGTALAQLAAREGQKVRLWMRDSKQAEAINETRHNPRYLSDFELHENIAGTTDMEQALVGADWVMVAVPSQAVRSCLTEAKKFVGAVPLVLAAKGIENETLMTMD